MEEIIFQVYGTLLLTLAGFVLPLLAVALSFFPEGVKELIDRYENERKQAEDNLIREETKKKKSEDSQLDYDLLLKNIDILKSAKKKAAQRLFYLNPTSIVSRSVYALGISLISFLVFLFSVDKFPRISYGLILLSLFFLFWALMIFWRSIESIIEAASAVQDIRRRNEEKTLDLLTTIADNSKSKTGVPTLFINPSDINVDFKKEELIEDKEYTFSVNKEHVVSINFRNQSEYILNRAELGIMLPPEVLVKETSNISSVFTGEKDKIIRFKHEYIQAKSNIFEQDIFLTFLNEGDLNATAFLKGENLKSKFIKFKIKVVP